MQKAQLYYEDHQLSAKDKVKNTLTQDNIQANSESFQCLLFQT